MSSLASKGSYNHHAREIGPDHWRLSWTVDFKHEGSRLRYPRVYTRDTDLAGAKRFARRWGLAEPVPKPRPGADTAGV